MREKNVHFRRSRSLLPLAFFIPGTALALFNFLGHIGRFWTLVQIVLMGGWRFRKRYPALIVLELAVEPVYPIPIS